MQLQQACAAATGAPPQLKLIPHEVQQAAPPAQVAAAALTRLGDAQVSRSRAHRSIFDDARPGADVAKGGLEVGPLGEHLHCCCSPSAANVPPEVPGQPAVACCCGTYDACCASAALQQSGAQRPLALPREGACAGKHARNAAHPSQLVKPCCGEWVTQPGMLACESAWMGIILLLWVSQRCSCTEDQHAWGASAPPCLR